MYAAKIEKGKVKQVIVGDPAWAVRNLGGEWIASLTKVGIGWEQYDGGLRPPSPYPSWIWDGSTWNPPIPYPTDGEYEWDEQTTNWVAYEES